MTTRFPARERYGLAAQMRRSATSIGSNIAEGAGRDSKKDLRRFLSMAAGSASELQYQLELSRDLEFVGATDADTLLEEAHRVKRMLAGLITKVGRQITTD